MRILANICSDDLEASKAFYTELLGLQVKYDSDWYIQLCCPNQPELEYGIIHKQHQLVPEEYQTTTTGMYITFVVDNVDDVYNKALSMNIAILQTPRNEFYGQRRFLVKDPNNCLVDICSPCQMD